MINLHKKAKILVLCTCLMGTFNGKQENKILFVNDQGVKIYVKDYNKFLSIGVNDKEIQFLTQTEYDEYSKINPIQTLKSESIHNEIDTKKKFSNREGNSSKTDSTRKIETFVTWYNVENVASSAIFVKTNVYILSTKSCRIKDLIGITYSDNVTTDYIYVSGKGQRPNFSAKQFYTEDYSRTATGLGMTPESEQYTKQICIEKEGYNCEDYKFELYKDIAVDFSVPSDYHYQSTPNEEYAQIDEKIDQTFSNFSYTFSQYFLCSQTTLNAVSFNGFFSEQRLGVAFTIDSITISINPPNVTLSSVFGNKFNDTIYSLVTVKKE